MPQKRSAKTPRKQIHRKQIHPEPDREQRLQKVLAAAGFGSRRSCEELIVDGRVEVDGKVASELGTRVDPNRSEIRVDGAVLKKARSVYYAVNKPTGVLCTNNDPQRRLRVIDLVPNGENLFTIGRLDRHSEGLILVTNDGDLANRVAHPRYGVTKTYQVRVVGSPRAKDLDSISEGVYFAEGFAKAESVKVKKRLSNTTDLLIVMKEGRNREIRRLLARIGFKVLKLKRTRVGDVNLADLPEGAYRSLSKDEIRQLKSSNVPASTQRRKKRSPPTKKKASEVAERPKKQRRPKSAEPGESRQGTVLGFEPTASLKAKAKPKATAKPKPSAKAKPKASAKAKPKPRAKAKPKASAKAKPKPRAKAKPKPRAKAKPKPNAKGKPRARKSRP